MLYFFVYHDSSAGEEEKMRRYEERADIDNKNIDPVQEQLVLSTELIRQDRNKKPDYSLVIIICCIFIGRLEFIRLIDKPQINIIWIWNTSWIRNYIILEYGLLI